MHYSFRIDAPGLERTAFLIERATLDACGDLETAFLDHAGPLTRHRGTALGPLAAALADDPGIEVLAVSRNPALVLDPGLPARIAAALEMLAPLAGRWSLAAAGGLTPAGGRVCALYSSATPFIPVHGSPQPLTDPLPDLYLIDAAWLRLVAARNCVLPDTGRQVPAHLRYWRIAEALGQGDLHRESRAMIDKQDRSWVEERLEHGKGPLLAIHPGARWTTKCWPVESFAVVVARAARAYGFSPIILGSAAERPKAFQLEHLLKRFAPSTQLWNLAGETTLRQLAAVLDRADLLLTNDSGPMHLAAALGTSVVGLFTCTSAVRSGPPGDRHELVSTEVSCAAGYHKRCPHRGQAHMACLEELSTERVWQAFVRLIDRRGRKGATPFV